MVIGTLWIGILYTEMILFCWACLSCTSSFILPSFLWWVQML